MPGHNLILAVTGCFVLAFGWFGFNPGSTLGAVGNGGLRIGLIAVNTMLASACGAAVAMCYTWLTGVRKPDLGMMVNGLLAGLVAVTGACGFVSPIASCIIGSVAGFNVVFFAGLIEKVWKIDDPVGAIAVHGVNGTWGMLAVGLFADGLANYGGLQVRGLFFGDAGQLVAQSIAVVVCFVYVFGISWLFFKVYDYLFGMRVSPQVELAGLDMPELGTVAYILDKEPNMEPAAIASGIPNNISSGISASSWQQPQVGGVNQRPLGESPRMAPPQQNQQRPINPSYPGTNVQPEAWWHNQRNRPRRITLDSDRQ